MLFASMPDAKQVGHPVLLNRIHLISCGGMVFFFYCIDLFLFLIENILLYRSNHPSWILARHTQPSDPARCRSHHPPASPPGLTGRCCERTAPLFYCPFIRAPWPMAGAPGARAVAGRHHHARRRPPDAAPGAPAPPPTPRPQAEVQLSVPERGRRRGGG